MIKIAERESEEKQVRKTLRQKEQGKVYYIAALLVEAETELRGG